MPRRARETAAILTPLIEGQPLDGAFEPLAKKTQPPRRFTEATLLAAMESAGKQLDEEMRTAMKDTGLGTPPTRTAIIEALLKHGYMAREKSSSHRTATAIALNDALPAPRLRSVSKAGRSPTNPSAKRPGRHDRLGRTSTALRPAA